MKYKISVHLIRGESNLWIVEADSPQDAAERMCPANNDYWEYKVIAVRGSHGFQLYRKLLSDPMGSLQYPRRRRNTVTIGVWLPYGSQFQVTLVRDI